MNPLPHHPFRASRLEDQMRFRDETDEDRRPLAEAGLQAARIRELLAFMAEPFPVVSPSVVARREAFLLSQGVSR